MSQETLRPTNEPQVADGAEEAQDDTINNNILVDTVCEYLESAIEDYKNDGDYLSYATILEEYLGNPIIYTEEENVKILSKLYQVLENNLNLLYEISWDLPGLLLRYYETGIDFDYGLRKNRGLVDCVMKLFDLVSKNGNSKELFIKAIELFNDLQKISLIDNDDDKFLKVVDLKIHMLLQLLTICLKRIKTIYPSKFLSMAVASILKLYSWYAKQTHHLVFVSRRLYGFARDYEPPMKPDDYLKRESFDSDKDFENEVEIQKTIESDENYLQVTLLQSFLTQLVMISFKDWNVKFALEFYKSYQFKCLNKIPTSEEFDNNETPIEVILSRTTQLALSYDIELEESFTKIKSDSINLFKPVNESDKSIDDKVQDLIKFSINDNISNLYHPDVKTIQMSQIGLLYMVTQYTKEINNLFDIKPSEAIALTIRFISPFLISENFKHEGVVDAVLFWNWVSILKNGANEHYFSGIPKHQILLYLQILTFISATNSNPSVRMITLTLLTRNLTLLDEETSYTFLVDTLTSVPYDNVKSAIIKILKDLIIRPKLTVDDISNKLANADIKDEPANNDKKPSLPQRFYINLNNDRINDINALILENIDETFNSINENNSKVLLSYLNFTIGIKDKLPVDDIKEIILKADQQINSYNDSKIGEDKLDLDLLTFALESLKRFVE